MYRSAYNSLGEERLQEVDKNMSTTILDERGRPISDEAARSAQKKGDMTLSETDKFWLLRRDRNWMEIPGKFKIVRRTRERIFLEGITQILGQLEPSSYFNPVELWKHEKESEEKKKDDTEASSSAAETGNNGKKGKEKKPKKEPKLSRAEQLILDNKAAKQRERLEAEVTLIRNSKKDLLPLIRQLKFNESRFILLVQLLRNAVQEFQRAGNKREMYEVLWAIDALSKIAPFPTTPAPKTSKPALLFEKDSSLIFDDLKRVAALLKEARDVMENESDLVRMQLTEMSDCLPPLSKLSFGFQLDEWQKQALRWIDNNESVVICAPTSSGKTVLSTYVAVIFKAKKEQIEEEDAKKKSTAAIPAAKGAAGKNAANAKEAKKKAAALAGVEDDEDEEIDEEEADLLETQLTEEEEAAYAAGARALEEQVAALALGDDEDNLARLIALDRSKRDDFRHKKRHKIIPPDVEDASGSGQKVLFVVPSEPLVWQVAAYFTKMLREEGDRATRVAVVTDPLVFSPAKKFGLMPQIVVGTPFALESALTKPRGLFGRFETAKKAAGDLLAGGFDHFDWVIYDEVHALDGEEGAALQRLIRAMHCPFLALSATVGNAEQLKGWLQTVRNDQFGANAHTITVSDQAATSAAAASTAVATCSAEEKEKDLNVNLLVKQVRFINLQRYVWTTEEDEELKKKIEETPEGEEVPVPEKLRLVSPLAAVPSVQALKDGILSNSSLSFTSSDAYSLWLKMKTLFPKDAIAPYSPYAFFARDERITLARTKEYEDLLKKGLSALAASHPAECKTLLDAFAIKASSKEIDLCEVVLDLREKDMLPAVAFHLNTFDAVKLFQQVVSGLEYRQKLAHPRYYNQMKEESLKKNAAVQKIIDSCGGNDEELEKKMRSGEIQEVATVDTTAPHPDFCLSKTIPMIDHELNRLLFDMERNDGFEKRDANASKQRNETILKHALIRGLRRGVGLFIDEVSFPSYRRAIQKLASTGKLGLVISDSSLAFGVNMPFRTCIFCGEMRGELDELMAQQMSGRAGRRGLDVRGNIVYAGIRPSTMSRLMIGKVANITGEHRDPRYDSLILQPILSPRHCGYSRALVLAGQTLQQFCEQSTPQPSDVLALENLRRSQEIMTHLRFITQDPVTKAFVPDAEANSNYALLCLIWEMRHYPHESLTIGMLLDQIVEEFDAFVKTLNLRERRRNQELMDAKLNDFFSILVQLVGRTPWKPSNDPRVPDPPKLHELPYFTHDLTGARLRLYHKWEQLFRSQQADIPEKFAHLRDPVPPGTDLDGTFFECAIDRKYVFTLDEVKKQEIKHTLWHMGTVLKTMNNSLIVDAQYVNVNYFVFRDAFEKLRYLNSELIHDIVHVKDVSSFDVERRTDTAADVQRPPESELWTDLDTSPFNEALHTVLSQGAKTQVASLSLRDALLSTNALVRAEAEERVQDLVFVHVALQRRDAALAQVLLTWNLRQADHAERVAKAVARTSFSVAPKVLSSVSLSALSEDRVTAFAQLGVACWIAVVVKPELRALPLYAQELVALDLPGLDKETVSAFIALSAEQQRVFLPCSYNGEGLSQSLSENTVTESTLETIKKKLQEYVDLEEEEDDEDEEEEDDEEEEED